MENRKCLKCSCELPPAYPGCNCLCHDQNDNGIRPLPLDSKWVDAFIDQISRDDYLAINVARAIERAHFKYPEEFNKETQKKVEKIKKEQKAK